MAEEKAEIIRLKNDFYRDGFYKILLALAMTLLAILLLAVVSIMLHVQKPPPVTFAVDNEWRVLPPVPLNQPYLKTPDVLQWVSNVLPLAFTFDFVDYTKELKAQVSNFTNEGWEKYLDRINTYAKQTAVEDQKLFINSSAAGAPFVVNEGVLGGRYVWWVQMPIDMKFSSAQNSHERTLTFQIMVVRVSTLNNLMGIAIENIIATKDEGG